MAGLTKSTLSPARRRLLELMQRLNFGTIEGLRVRGGEPDLAGARVVRRVRFGGDNGPRPELRIADFALKAEHAELFEQLGLVGDGVVASIEVLHGLPCRMAVEQPASAV